MLGIGSLGIKLVAAVAAAAGPSYTTGSVTIEASRTTAHKDYLTDSAAYHLTAPVPTGHTIGSTTYIWRWTDAAGPHYIVDDINAAIRIYGDGSASYTCTVELVIVDGATLNVLDADGSALAVGDASGAITLTMTDNASAVVYTVTKSGSAITAVGSNGTTYYANESTGLSGNTGLSVGSPKQYLSQLIALDMTDAVWVLADATAATYTMDGIPSTTATNFELVGGVSGQTPVLDVASASQDTTAFAFATGTSDVRLVNVRRTNSTDSRGTAVAWSGTVSDISLFDVTIDNCDRWYSAGATTDDTDGLYIHGGTWTGGQLTGYLAGRSQHIGFVGVTHVLDASYTGDGNNAQNRMWNVRRMSVRGGSHTKGGTTNPIFRMLLQSTGPYWDDGGGVPVSSWLSWHSTTLTLTGTAVQALVSLNQDLTDGGGPTAGRYRNVLFSNVVFDRTIGGLGDESPGVGNNTGPESINDIVIRNCRAGSDGTNGVDGAGVVHLHFFTCAVTNLTVAQNEVLSIPYRASYAGIYTKLLGASSTVTGAKVYNNFAAYNAQTVNDPGEAMLRWSGIDTTSSSAYVGAGNKYAKVPRFGTNAATRFASNSGGGLTRAQWLASAGGANDLGYDWTDSEFTDTHYNLTTYTARAGGTLNTATVTRQAVCPFTAAGTLRAANTTAHRGDPNATANPYV